ncbi:MAG: hypothetical protein ACK4MV_08035 [Beijerinckiaceae bacterium]
MNPKIGALAQAARSAGLGRLLFFLFHRPLGIIKQSLLEGGPFQQRKTELGRLEMIDAALRLAPAPARKDEVGAKVQFLSGRHFWYQTVFCFVSLQNVAPFRITPVIFDDGTLDDETCARIARVVPWAEFVKESETSDKLADALPPAKFPTLWARRRTYVHLRKLVDMHAGQNDWSLVLDSDMLFFRQPVAVLDWFAAPRAMFMQDICNAYGYSPSLMARLSCEDMLAKVNVGLYGIDRSRIDWELVEYWCHAQIKEEGAQYLQEQALTALILTQQHAEALDAREYIVMPRLSEGLIPQGILHHYVAHSKRAYYQSTWRRVYAHSNGMI